MPLDQRCVEQLGERKQRSPDRATARQGATDARGQGGDAVDRQLVIIQGAAILAVCWEFRKKLLGTAFSLHSDATSRRFVINLVIAALPLAVLGLLFEKQIKALL